MIRISYLILCLMIITTAACQQKAVQSKSANKSTSDKTEKTSKSSFEVTKTSEQWKSELTDQEYYVLREAGTERAFTGDLWDNKADGIYTCRGCALPLFDSETKLKSGTCWPSYYQPLNKDCIEEDTDYHLGYARTEVHCARCGGHMGHVFKDGPKPTGLRYCINSVSLDFVERKDVKP